MVSTPPPKPTTNNGNTGTSIADPTTQTSASSTKPPNADEYTKQKQEGKLPPGMNYYEYNQAQQSGTPIPEYKPQPIYSYRLPDGGYGFITQPVSATSPAQTTPTDANVGYEVNAAQPINDVRAQIQTQRDADAKRQQQQDYFRNSVEQNINMPITQGSASLVGGGSQEVTYTTTYSQDKNFDPYAVVTPLRSEENLAQDMLSTSAFNYGQFRETEPVLGNLGLAAVGVGTRAVETYELGSSLLYEPTTTIPKVATNLYESGKAFISAPGETVGKYLQEFRTEPGYNFGKVAFDVALPEVAKVAVVSYKGILTKSATSYVPESQVFAKEVLTGESKFPLTNSVKESIARFKSEDAIVKVTSHEQVPTVKIINDQVSDFTTPVLDVGTQTDRYIVTHATPEGLKSDLISGGYKGEVGMEDLGLYVTPKGEGSPYFLGVAGEADKSISLIPFKGVYDVLVNEPQVLEIGVTDITRIPRSVVKEPGFLPSSEFTTMKATEGGAFITKRSEIGVGEVKSKLFAAATDFKSPFEGGQTVLRNGKQTFVQDVKAGDMIREAGTSEIEAVVPKNTLITEPRLVGYTKYEGHVIPIKRTFTVPYSAQSRLTNNGRVSNTLSSVTGSVEGMSERYFKGLGTVSPGVPFGSSSTKVSSNNMQISEPNIQTSNLKVTSTTSSMKPTSGSSFKLSNVNSSNVSSKSYPSYSQSYSNTSNSSNTSSQSNSSNNSSSNIISSVSSRSETSSNSFVSRTSRVSSKSNYSNEYSYSSNKISKSVSSPMFSFKKSDGDMFDSFDVFVREKKKFIKVNKSAQTFANAKNLGGYYTENTPTATFFLKRVNDTAGNAETSYQFNSKQYTSGKKNSMQFTEKNTFRINTGGELQGITVKGLLAKQNKRGMFSL